MFLSTVRIAHDIVSIIMVYLCEKYCPFSGEIVTPTHDPLPRGMFRNQDWGRMGQT